MAVPALKALSACGVRLQIVSPRGWVSDLLAGHGWPVTRLPSGLRAAPAALRAAQGPGHGLLLTNSFSSAWAFRAAGIRALGFRGDGRGLLLARSLPRLPERHEAEVFWHLCAEALSWLGGSGWPAERPASLGLDLTATHREAAREALARAGLNDRPYAVLAPFAAGQIRGQDKRWSGFGELEPLLRAQGLATVVCPGPGETPLAHEVVPGATLLPELGLGAYAAVCEQARVTVANDSGPMHLACAVNAPVVGVFGPSDPARTGPVGTRACALGGKGIWPTVPAVIAAALRISV